MPDLFPPLLAWQFVPSQSAPSDELPGTRLARPDTGGEGGGQRVKGPVWKLERG